MPFMIDYSADIQISECMNDIINQVETREWNRVNGHRDRLVKKMKKQNEKVEYWKNSTGEAEDKLDEQMKVNEEMSENWEIATEKIGQENSDLHNEIKRLKEQIKRIQKGSEATTEKNSRLVSTLYKHQEENEKLKEEIKNIKDWCLSDEMKEQTSAETIEEFEADVRDNWDEIKLLKDENEKYKSALMNSSGSFKCEKCNIHLTEDDVYRSVDECEGKLLCESCWED
jgi:chromosome segregation ATPase